MSVVKCIYPTGKTSSAGIEIDAFISESYHFGNSITNNTSEDGGGTGTVTDESDTLSIEAFIGSVKFEEAIGGGESEAVDFPTERVKSAFAELRRLKESKKPMDIVTGLTVMTDMVITSLDISRDEATGADLSFSMSFTKAPKLGTAKANGSSTSSATATPAGESAASSVNTGKSGTSEADAQLSSIVKEIADRETAEGHITWTTAGGA